MCYKLFCVNQMVYTILNMLQFIEINQFIQIPEKCFSFWSKFIQDFQHI